MSDKTDMEELLKEAKGKNGPAGEISAKKIGLYFSAHWCPPCRGFTPELVKFYNNCKSDMKDQLEIIFVSSDRNDAQFEEYYETMPWLYIDREDEDMKEKLMSKYKVQGIPMFVILDRETGALDTTDGRSKVTKSENDPAKFEW